MNEFKLPESYEKLKSQLRKHEGSRDAVYLDTEGYPTIGIGHLLPMEWVNKVGYKFTAEQIAEYFDKDVLKAVETAKKVSGPIAWSTLSDCRKAVLINMAFNLGEARLLGFKNFWTAIRRNHFEIASIEMLNSKWARQVKGRAIELSVQMRTDKWA